MFALVALAAAGSAAYCPSSQLAQGGDAPAAKVGEGISPPQAEFVSRPGARPLQRVFDARASVAPGSAIARYRWTFGDGSTARGPEVTHTFARPGCFVVQLTVIDADGAQATTEERVAVSDADVTAARVVFEPALPRAGAVIPREVGANVGRVTVAGTIGGSGWTDVRATWTASSGDATTYRGPVCDGTFSFEATLPAQLEARDLRVEVVSAGRSEVLAKVADLVAGDVLFVTGQSNAVARAYRGSANGSQSPFVRSFGSRTADPARSKGDDAWHRAEGDANEGPGAIGQWALRMASQLIRKTGVPLAVVNGARDGKPIGHFQRNDEDPLDPDTNYGRALERLRRAGLAGAVRAILYYQGESDGDRAQRHRDGFVALHSDWQEDFPNVERVYVTQVRAGCLQPSLQLRDTQRRLRDVLDDVSVMSATAIDAHDGCHFGYAGGYDVLGDRYARLLARDLYHLDVGADVEAVDVARATMTGNRLRIVTRGDATALEVDPGVEADFELVHSAASILGVAADGTDLLLTLSTDDPPTAVRYHAQTPGTWIRNGSGVGMLAFELPVD